MNWVARLGATIGTVTVIATAGATVSAEPPSEAARDKLNVLLRTGAESAKKKDFAACIEALAEAMKIEPTPARQGELGLCEEAAGRDPDAYRDLAAALNAPGADRSSAPLLRVTDAFARVSARTVHVYVAVDPPQARVVVDGRPLGQAEGRSIILSPGKHVFAARLDGYEDAVERPPEYEAGQSASVHLALKPKSKPALATSGAPVASGPARHVEPSPAWYVPGRSGRGAAMTAAYVAGAAFLVSSAVALGLEVDRASIASTTGSCFRGDAAQPIPVSPLCDRLHERKLQANVAWGVTAGTGFVSGALVGLAVVLSRSAYRPSITPTASTNGGGIVLSGAW